MNPSYTSQVVNFLMLKKSFLFNLRSSCDSNFRNTFHNIYKTSLCQLSKLGAQSQQLALTCTVLSKHFNNNKKQIIKCNWSYLSIWVPALSVDVSEISFSCLIAWFAWEGLIRLGGLPDLPEQDWSRWNSLPDLPEQDLFSCFRFSVQPIPENKIWIDLKKSFFFFKKKIIFLRRKENNLEKENKCYTLIAFQY